MRQKTTSQQHHTNNHVQQSCQRCLGTATNHRHPPHTTTTVTTTTGTTNTTSHATAGIWGRLPHARGAIPGAMVARSLSFSFGASDEEPPEAAGPAEGKRAKKQKVAGQQCTIVDCDQACVGKQQVCGCHRRRAKGLTAEDREHIVSELGRGFGALARPSSEEAMGILPVDAVTKEDDDYGNSGVQIMMAASAAAPKKEVAPSDKTMLDVPGAKNKSHHGT